VSRYIGETEKNLGRVLDQAAQAGAILFFDEADALLGKRTEVEDSHNRYAYHQRAAILELMKNYAGLTILSINRSDAISRSQGAPLLLGHTICRAYLEARDRGKGSFHDTSGR
jgi:SpoVK/Ycf46/Vps4 family AAA+-type ATPase